ncbi:MAG: 2-oxoglutarate ferredoxin oxidoreductase subunit alpha, partial [Ignavibacteriaceae bacterium]|nr:2-oxoglutarate ferredoxin oxidoreductase subunit alpha [Ignavibacteriaceae bacterium]
KYLNPFPKNSAEVLKKYKTVLVPELNLGQLSHLLRSEYLIDVVQLNKVQGLPFKSIEIEERIIEILGGNNGK